MQYGDEFDAHENRTWIWALGIVLFAIVMGTVTAGLIVIWTRSEGAALSAPTLDAGGAR